VYAYLGVSVSTPTSRERRDAGADPEEGVRVETVDKGSPAAGALQENDLLVKVNGQTVRDSDQFVRLIGVTSTERPSQLVILRGGREQAVSVTLGRRQAVVAAVTRESRKIRWEGMLLGPVPKNWRGSKESAAETEHGLVVLAVGEKSRFAKQGVREGDVITAIAGRSLADVTDLQQVLNDLPPDKRDIKLVSRKSAVASVQPHE
jgi:serine protease Do